MFKRKPKVLIPEEQEEIRTKDFFDMILPGTIKFLFDHYIVGDSYRCVWAIREYPPSTEEQAILSQLADRSGVTLRIYHRLVESMEQRKIIQNATRRNKLKSGGTDVNETIEAEGNLQDVIELLANLRKNREPLLHCSVFIELKARNMDALKELQSEIAMELTRSKISVDRLTLRQKEGFLSVLPVGTNQFGAQYERVLPASSAANLYPFNFSGKTDPKGIYIGRDISALYDLWYEQRDKITGTYQDTPEQRISLSQNKEFKAVKNAVIQESLNILYDRITFEESVSEPEEFAPDEPEPEETRAESSVPKKWWNDPDHPLFQYRKAKEYLDKDSPLYDPAEAVRWLLLSAEQGYEYAQYRLGKLYLLGDEIEQDFQQAESWLEQASDQGNSCAKYSLAKMHLAGLAVQSDEVKAIRLLRESADDGNQWAQYLLGKFCFRGEHTEKNLQEAERLLTASAMQKNSQAQYLLAKLYLCEDGIPKDAEKALHWLWESVKQKNQYAQYLLGKMLLFGKETDRDVETGIALLSASAEQGNVYAARLLQSYYSGRLRNPSLGMAAVRLLSQLGRMFTDRLRRNEDGQRAVIEKKLRQKIEEKKQAHGMKMG